MFGLLIREGKNRGELKNAGDFVQSIAHRQFLHGKETCLVEIEELSDFKSDKDINVIMNGWFMWDCSKFLPPACINPLFVSFHLTPPQEKNFFTPEVIQYLKKYQPIGTRDVLTAELMRKYGIDSYFSGCLTMTLGKEYLSDRHDGGIYIVDPYIEFGGDKSKPFFVKVYNTIKFCIKNFNKAKLLKGKFVNQCMMPRLRHRVSWALEDFIERATFYEVYSKRFSDDILLNAKYLTVLIDNSLSIEEKFDVADKMLREYSRARLVITSRLHVSFPCLALGTPNIFVIPSQRTEEKDVKRYSGRLGGLEDTVTVLELDRGSLKDKFEKLPEIMTIDNFPPNKAGYKKYAEELTKTVTDFVCSNK